jgi:hypothetical protein
MESSIGHEGELAKAQKRKETESHMMLDIWILLEKLWKIQFE